jgi:hypothetical protein
VSSSVRVKEKWFQVIDSTGKLSAGMHGTELCGQERRA